MDIEVTIQEKVDDLPFHELTEERRNEFIEEMQRKGDYKSPKVLFERYMDDRLIPVLQAVTEELTTQEDADNGACYFYINHHTVHDLLRKLEEEMEAVLAEGKRYDPATYRGKFLLFADFRAAVKHHLDTEGFNDTYLMVYGIS